jgi:putative spermidine/putrescine transport system ATP-binding protein
VRVREELREIQRAAGITAVFVTHDQEEAMAIADRVAILRDGRIEQYDAPETLYRHPRTQFVATFVGTMNMFLGTPAGRAVRVHGDLIPCDEPPGPADGLIDLAVRPEDVVVAAEAGRPAAGAGGRVHRRIAHGHYDELVVDTGWGLLRAFMAAEDVPALSEGTAIRYRFRRCLQYRDGVLAPAADVGARAALPTP